MPPSKTKNDSFVFVFPDQTVMERVTDGRWAAGLHEVGEDHETRKRRRIVPQRSPKTSHWKFTNLKNLTDQSKCPAANVGDSKKT